MRPACANRDARRYGCVGSVRWQGTDRRASRIGRRSIPSGAEPDYSDGAVALAAAGLVLVCFSLTNVAPLPIRLRR